MLHHDFKAIREHNRATALKHSRTERARALAAKLKPLPSAVNAACADVEQPPRQVRHATRVPPCDVDEAKRLAASPPASAVGVRDSLLSDLHGSLIGGAREVLLVDLPRKPHKKTLSSTFEIVTLPKIIALSDSVGPAEPGRQGEKAEDDWERVDDFLEARASYAQVARGD